MQPNVDRVAQLLGEAALMAKRMPPMWNGDRLSITLGGPQGQYFGKMLPGVGVYVPWDLRALGIMRPIRYVYDRSRVMYGHDLAARLTDRLALPPLSSPWYRTTPGRVFCPERAGVELARWRVPLSRTVTAAKQLAATITTYDGIITSRAGGKANDSVTSKASLTTVAQAFSSLYRAGGLPEAGTYTNIPGGAVHDRATTGAWHGLTNPTNPDKKYLLTFGFGSASAIDWLILVDLLVACGNINANLNTAQAITSTAQTRQYGTTLGAGVMGVLEVTTALGATPANVTMNSYTDQDGNAASTNAAEAMTASCIANRLQPVGVNSPWLVLAAGDFGIRSVESGITFSAAMGSGVCALNLVFPLMYIPGLASNLYIERDSTTQIDGLTELVAASFVIGCLTVFVQTNSTTSGQFKGFARTCAG